MKVALVLLFGVGLIAAVGAAYAGVFWALWNRVLPLVWSSAPHLSFWQAWGVLILLGFLKQAVFPGARAATETSK